MSLAGAVLAVALISTWGSVLSVWRCPGAHDRRARLVNMATEMGRSGWRPRGCACWTPVVAVGRGDRWQLATWLALFYTGFALVLQLLDPLEGAHAFAQAGSSLFTLGYTGPDTAQLSIVDYLAGSDRGGRGGPQIHAIPSHALQRLQPSRDRGHPAVQPRRDARMGTGDLARTRYGFTSADDGAVMDLFYLQWERWAADLSESHSNSPVLMRFRSPAILARGWSRWSPSWTRRRCGWPSHQTEHQRAKPDWPCGWGSAPWRSLAAMVRHPGDPDPDPDGDLHPSERKEDRHPCGHPAPCRHPPSWTSAPRDTLAATSGGGASNDQAVADMASPTSSTEIDARRRGPASASTATSSNDATDRFANRTPTLHLYDRPGSNLAPTRTTTSATGAARILT